MKPVTGVGGIFFKAKDPEGLREWYRKHLGIESESWGGFAFEWKKDPRAETGATIWSVFPEHTKYFEPANKPYMINFRVADLTSLLAQLREEGVDVDGKSGEESEFGKFGLVMDPEGNRVELWEPPANRQ
jgi:predicted enzyme related to lactoylglutathione lyase